MTKEEAISKAVHVNEEARWLWWLHEYRVIVTVARTELLLEEAEEICKEHKVLIKYNGSYEIRYSEKRGYYAHKIGSFCCSYRGRFHVWDYSIYQDTMRKKELGV